MEDKDVQAYIAQTLLCHNEGLSFQELHLKMNAQSAQTHQLEEDQFAHSLQALRDNNILTAMDGPQGEPLYKLNAEEWEKYKRGKGWGEIVVG